MGILNAIRHALTHRADHYCFQTDSLLVAQHINCIWACRHEALRPFLEEAWQCIGELERRGSQIIVEHIYREYNTVADRLANAAVDARADCHWRRPP